VIALPSGAPTFPGLAALGRIESERRQGDGKPARWVHYVALSKKLSPRRMLEVNRTHWSVENHLHWPLDVVFHEDDARTRKDYGPQNLAEAPRMATDNLGSHPDNRSLARKMKLAAWRKEFFYGHKRSPNEAFGSLLCATIQAPRRGKRRQETARSLSSINPQPTVLS